MPRQNLQEGVVKKGGQNPAPTSQRPAPPQGQGTPQGNAPTSSNQPDPPSR
jgi:hypothetical protein